MASSAHSSDDVMADINVTPLVDITLVLLIVFIVTAKLIVGQTLPMDLPKAATGSEQQVVFSVEMASSGDIAVDGHKVDSEDAVSSLAKSAHDKNPELRAVIDADEKVSHGKVVKVMDRMKQAGITRIAFGISADR